MGVVGSNEGMEQFGIAVCFSMLPVLKVCSRPAVDEELGCQSSWR
jgi:hypothetical protein